MAALNALIKPVWIRQKQYSMTLVCLTNGGNLPLNMPYISIIILQWSAFNGALHFRRCTE
jgi:hypothetical protein